MDEAGLVRHCLKLVQEDILCRGGSNGCNEEAMSANGALPQSTLEELELLVRGVQLLQYQTGVFDASVAALALDAEEVSRVRQQLSVLMKGVRVLQKRIELKRLEGCSHSYHGPAATSPEALEWRQDSAQERDAANARGSLQGDVAARPSPIDPSFWSACSLMGSGEANDSCSDLTSSGHSRERLVENDSSSTILRTPRNIGAFSADAGNGGLVRRCSGSSVACGDNIMSPVPDGDGTTDCCSRSSPQNALVHDSGRSSERGEVTVSLACAATSLITSAHLGHATPKASSFMASTCTSAAKEWNARRDISTTAAGAQVGLHKKATQSGHITPRGGLVEMTSAHSPKESSPRRNYSKTPPVPGPSLASRVRIRSPTAEEEAKSGRNHFRMTPPVPEPNYISIPLAGTVTTSDTQIRTLKGGQVTPRCATFMAHTCASSAKDISNRRGSSELTPPMPGPSLTGTNTSGPSKIKSPRRDHICLGGGGFMAPTSSSALKRTYFEVAPPAVADTNVITSRSTNGGTPTPRYADLELAPVPGYAKAASAPRELFPTNPNRSTSPKSGMQSYGGRSFSFGDALESSSSSLRPSSCERALDQVTPAVRFSSSELVHTSTLATCHNPGSNYNCAGPEHLMPACWRACVAAAYRTKTKRAFVERIKVLECSMVADRLSHCSGFVLHTIVRWGDILRGSCGQQSTTKQGEDVVLFALMPEMLSKCDEYPSSKRGENSQEPDGPRLIRWTPTTPTSNQRSAALEFAQGLLCWSVTDVKVLLPLLQDNERTPQDMSRLGDCGNELLQLALSGCILCDTNQAVGCDEHLPIPVSSE